MFWQEGGREEGMKNGEGGEKSVERGEKSVERRKSVARGE